MYEYEPEGVGGCTASSSTFNAASGGCTALISSGVAAGESGFIDASETGSDVFFLTTERLVRQDRDTALDLYDAHTCANTTPCPQEPETPPTCTTADACRGPVSEQPAIFGAPPSATLQRAGNLPPPPPPTPKAPTQAQKLAKALKACHKHKNKHQRKTCEQQAHKHHPTKPRRGKTRR
jgi:hypothetical protein